MSDLQCAATLYVLGPEADAPEQLPDEARVAAVWCAPSRRAQAAALAQRWGCSVRDEPGLDAPAWPPRPADPKQPWDPEWNVRVRTKATATALLGVDFSGMDGGEVDGDREQPTPEEGKGKKLLRGLLRSC